VQDIVIVNLLNVYMLLEITETCPMVEKIVKARRNIKKSQKLPTAMMTLVIGCQFCIRILTECETELF